MGVEYYIVDDDKLECFDLGKGTWFNLPLSGSLDEIVVYLMETVKKTFSVETPDSYFTRLAAKIHYFIQGCASVKLMSDDTFLDDFYTQNSTCKDIPNRRLCTEVENRYEDTP